MKVLSLNGILGYGYSEEALQAVFQERPDYIGVDGGSTDPGPYYLGKGVSFTDRAAVKRDVERILPFALSVGAPFIVGTGGGSGSEVHLNWLRDIVLEIAREQSLSFRMAMIYSDITKAYALEKLAAGKLTPLGNLEASEASVADSVRIVSQIGVAPLIKALQGGAQVILAGRCCDTAIYAAPCLLHGYDPGLAFHMAKIMECGAMCASPVAAADMMMARMERDYFELTPPNPLRRCTVRNVAAHTLYEQGDPYHIFEPDGAADLSACRFEQVAERTVRVSGSRFVPAEKTTLKLEGVRSVGFRSLCIAGINDPLTAQHMEESFEKVCDFVKETLAGRIAPDTYQIQLRQFGRPSSAEGAGPRDPLSYAMGLIIDVVGRTQEIADTVLALARSRLLHFDYPGRKSTAGNLAFPYSPSDLHAGEVFEFSLYHLAEVEDLAETARLQFIAVGETHEDF